MNSNWRNRPTTIDNVSRGVDYIVSIDESGNSSLKQVLKAQKQKLDAVDSEKHFTVTACSVAMSDFEIAKNLVMELKCKYWDNALFDYDGSRKRVCFHSNEIRGRKGAFSPKVIDYDSFIIDLSEMMKRMPVTLYAAHIDKVKHVSRYAYPLSPYDLCMTFVIERIVRDIPANATCVIIMEARGAKEDKALLEQIKKLLDYGNEYHSPKEFRKVKGVYFNPKWCQAENNQTSYWGLELADLCAYPIQKFFLYGNRDKAFELLVPKLSCYPAFMGKGLKSFP